MAEDRSHDEIRRIALELWNEEGRPEGKDREFWERAKEIWAFQRSPEDEPRGQAQAGAGERKPPRG